MENEEKISLPIGVFDSGVGGISVLRELVRLLPGEDFYFVGDNAHAPYGTKTREEIRALTMAQVEEMRKRGIKALVVACNTATSAAIELLRSTYRDMPVIGIEPAVKPAVTMKAHPRIIVMATPGTVHGDKYKRLMARYEKEAEIIPVGCPGLMEFVERGELESEALSRYLEELLLPLTRKSIDAIVLGCTHYPFVKEAIRAVVGDGPVIMDGSEGTARQTKRLLIRHHLLRTDDHKGEITFHMTGQGKEELCDLLIHKE